MGYCASGDGIIVLKKGISTEEAKEILKSYDHRYEVEINIEEDENKQVVLDIVRPHDKWRDDEETELFELIAPYIESGHMDFEGEEECYWRYQYNPETKEWDEYSGEIVFGIHEPENKDIFELLCSRGLIRS